MKKITQALQKIFAQTLILSLMLSGSLSAQAGSQTFIPIGVGDITTFIPILPSPDTTVTVSTQTVGGDIYDISWSAIGNADYYQIEILAEDGSISQRRVEGTNYSLAGLPLGQSTVTLLACNAQDQCGANDTIGTYNTAERVRYAHADILGSPVLETDQAANVLQAFHYKPFGETEEEKREDIGYTGHLEDTDLELTYMQARYYDPVIGRFYGNDPVGFVEHAGGLQGVQGFNRYAYVNNNPYKFVDPDGETSYLVSRPLNSLAGKVANHNFIVTNADSIGDPNATVHSFGNDGNGNMGKVDDDTTGMSLGTLEVDTDAWSSADEEGSTTTFREIDAKDSTVDDIANSISNSEQSKYTLVPGILGGTNSNSGAGAVANTADGGATSVDNGKIQPGHKQADRVNIDD